MSIIRKISVLLFITVFTATLYAQFGQVQNLVIAKAYLSVDKVLPGKDFKIALKINIDPQWHINSNIPHEDYLIPSKLLIDTAIGFSLTKINYPDAHDRKLSFSDKPLSVFEKEIFISAIAKVPVDLKPGLYKLPVIFDYQSCNDKTCLPPNSVSDTLSIEVAANASAVKEINQDIFQNVKSTGSLTNSDAGDNSISSRLEKSGLLLSLIFVFIGGLALNLTPCVYPLIPITIGFFGGQAEGKTSRLFMMGLLFVVGLAITYSVIGVVTALSGAVFGSLLQNTLCNNFYCTYISCSFVKHVWCL